MDMNTINFIEHTVEFPLQQWLHEGSTMIVIRTLPNNVTGHVRTLNVTYTDFYMRPFSYVT